MTKQVRIYLNFTLEINPILCIYLEVEYVGRQTEIQYICVLSNEFT